MRKYSLSASKYKNRENAETWLSPFTVNFFFCLWPVKQKIDESAPIVGRLCSPVRIDYESGSVVKISEVCTSVPMLGFKAHAYHEC